MNSIRAKHRIYQATLQTLSPIHIGGQGTLGLNIDIISDASRTYRLDTDKILSELFTDSMFARMPLPGEIFMTVPETERAQYYLYSLQGKMRAQTTNSQLREFIKTPDYKPYIPGSSLKGALRTALAWSGWNQVFGDKKPLTEEVRTDAKHPGQVLESKMFAPNDRAGGSRPNYDLMRGLLVGDLHLQETQGANWRVLNVQVAKMREFASPIEVEAIDRDTFFAGRITIDDQLLSDHPFPNLEGLGLQDRRAWLDNLLPSVNLHSRHLLERLITHFRRSGRQDASELVRFFEGLDREIGTFSTEDPSCILPIGWGGGWDSKTFGSHLQRDPERFEEIVVKKQPSFKSRKSAKRNPGDPFPLTRRVAVESSEDSQQGVRISAPLGWVKLTLRQTDGSQA